MTGVFYPPVVPHGQGDALRRAAEAHIAALAQCGEEVTTALLERMRFVTKLNNESELEKVATFNSLVKALKEVPADILADSIAAYVNAHGERWFPKSAGEIKEFTDPRLLRRNLRIQRLKRLADISDETPDPVAVAASWDAPIPLDQVEEENKLFKSVGSTMRYNPQTGVIYQMKRGEEDPCQLEEQEA